MRTRGRIAGIRMGKAQLLAGPSVYQELSYGNYDITPA